MKVIVAQRNGNHSKEVADGLQRAQITAIIREATLGGTLQKMHGFEIMRLYRTGLTREAISEKLGIDAHYGVTSAVAISAISRALRGNNGALGTQAYKGLINKGELEALKDVHISEGGRRGGNRTRELGIGAHSLTHEERREAGAKGGLKAMKLRVGAAYSFTDEQRLKAGRNGGLKAAELGLGINSFTHEQRQEASRKGALARGIVLWVEPEIEDLITLSNGQEYQYQNGPNKGRPKASSIANELNKKYHGEKAIRSANTVKRMLYTQKHSLLPFQTLRLGSSPGKMPVSCS